eukprot:CAMPEP_0205825084 /NCGR_PEP_ID=MMETSP0206-20130828/23865_1 /ASSEMBLY_ACC=CAM_ASM_000279 /TAXON_ID=36767 /ORGANISM="Euplotes focardii, Strain TN1" /LENGTH=366 /DNA_ID=CAMNT_0053123815 /DNA_START=26 /DNA_END=1126 /DNA_ORIENTATION=-
MNDADVQQMVTSFIQSAAFLTGDQQDSQPITVTLLVPEPAVPGLIGRGGAVINVIKAACGCELSFAKRETSVNNHRMLYTTGSIAGISLAVLVSTGLMQQAGCAPSIGIVVADSCAGAVIGKGGENLKSLRETTGCSVTLTKRQESHPALGGRSLTFSHPDAPPAIAEGCYRILRLDEFSSPPRHHGGAGAGMFGFGQMQMAVDPNTICSVHGKKRGAGNMHVVMGRMVCLPEDQCKGIDPNMIGAAMDPYAALVNADFGAQALGYAPARNALGAPRFNPYARAGQGGDVCSVHGKRRGPRNLAANALGQLVCLPEDQCKIGGGMDGVADANSMCATHGKRRGPRNLQPHSTNPGVYVCLDSDPCK